MGTLRAELADVESRLAATEERARELPHREKHLRLVTGFLRGYLDLHRELVDAVEAELGGVPGASA